LTSINEQLNNSHDRIKSYEAKLRKTIEWVIILATLLGIRILLMITGYILYSKGVVLPRWLDILL
jgi:hypothetical protein